MSIKEHLDYEWVRFAQNVNLFVSGALDATLAMSYNEYYQLMQAGVEMTDTNVYRFCDHGYNVQEDGVYMTWDYYEKHKDQALRFAEASRRGWEWAAEHPDMVQQASQLMVENQMLSREITYDEIIDKR